MIRTSRFFSWRYLRGAQQSGPLSSLVKICFVAILLGTFCLTVAAAIMQGFKQATYTTLQSVQPDVIIQAQANQDLNSDAITRVIEREFPQIIATAPRASNYVIIETDHSHSAQQTVLTLQALDPDREAKTTKLEQTIALPKGAKLADLLDATQIIIGSKLAQDLGVAAGDSVTLYYAQIHEQTSGNLTFKSYTVTIAGLFCTGIADYDTSVIWGSFALFNKLFEEGVTSLGLRLAPNALGPQTVADLQKRLGLSVNHWYSLYPALLQALELEDYAMYLILFFIVILASLTMASTLMLHIEQKRKDIAILRVMGMTSGDVTKVFLLFGVGIAATATLCGMLCGLATSWIINTYQVITLPDAYYISYLPAHISPSYFILLFGIACGISFVVVGYAASKSHAVSLSAILRGETCS